jgi:putative DNA primase/helicase
MGDYGVARCPSHRDRIPSLSVKHAGGKVLVHCHAGCSQQKLIAALRERGLWPCTSLALSCPKQAIEHRVNGTFSEKSTEGVERIWNQAIEVQRTLAEQYLHSRLITISPPPSIRYLRYCYHRTTGLYLPAVITGIQNSSGNLTAIQRVYLRPDGLGKAQVTNPKLSLGPMGDGAVRLGRASETLGLCEGWETGLSVVQLYAVPVWAAVGAGRMHRVYVPDSVRRLIIFADNDRPGHEAAARTAHVHEGLGRRVEIRTSSIGKDFNDELVGKEHGHACSRKADA